MQHVRKPRTAINHEARHTSDKIDAIESELSAEFGTQQWLPSETSIAPGKDLPPLSQCLDEAALLFTNHQIDAARDILLQACGLPGDEPERRQAWWMLFELALEQHQPEFFERLALDYAHTFETSPPQWRSLAGSPTDPNTALPVVNFRGKLSGNSMPALRQLQQAGLRHGQFCLEFGTLYDIDLDGCASLLQVLADWQLHHCRFSIAGGDLLAAALKPLIQSGRRDQNDAGWRLMIELMRLMNRHSDHESLCIDYCLTYEVSPPSGPMVVGPSAGSIASATPAGSFLLPAHIMLPVDDLLGQMQHYARSTPAITLDGHQLTRIDISAASPWLNGVHRIAGGKPVECRNIGFLVARLLKLVGGSSSLDIIHRKP